MEDYYNCPECSYKTKLLCFLQRHVERHKTSVQQQFDCTSSDLKPYWCYNCNNNYQTEFLSQIKQHINDGHNVTEYKQPLYECTNCEFDTFSKYLFMRHSLFGDCGTFVKNEAKIQSRISRFQCKYCPYKPTTNNDLVKHVIRKHTDPSKIEWVECGHCSAKFKDKETLRTHIKIHMSARLRCQYCTFETVHKNSLVKHTKTQHSDPNSMEKFECQFCLYEAKEKAVLKKHTKLQHSAQFEWFKCDLCDYKSKNRINLKSHKISIHDIVVNDEYFQCKYCDFKALYKPRLIFHMKLKHAAAENIEWFQCPHCPHKTKLKHNLQEHVITKHLDPDEITWYYCDQCEYRAKIKNYVKRHIKIQHSGSKLFKCGLCRFRTEYETSLQKHKIKRHNSKEFLECGECDYTTKNPKYLRTHKLTHDQNWSFEWFNCDKCSFVGNSKHGLKEHENKVHSDTVYECADCPYKVKSEKYLKKHQKEHQQ